MRTFKTLQTLSLKRLLAATLWCSILSMGAGCQCCQLTEWYADRIDHIADCPWNMEWAYCRSCDLTRIDCRDCQTRGHRIANCPQAQPQAPAMVHASDDPKSQSPAILQVSAAVPVQESDNSVEGGEQ